MRSRLSGKSAIIVFHGSTIGPAHDLRDFLLKEGIGELLFISHPLLYIKDNFGKSSKCEYFRGKKLTKSKVALHWVLPEHLLYLKDFFYTLFWSITLIGKIDYFFGLGNLNAFAGYLLKIFGRVKKTVYYVIDYIPNRFENHIINEIYHKIEKFCALYCDSSWNLSPRMIEARNKRWGVVFPNQLVVMHGVHFERIKRLPYKEINKNEIIYMGGLLKKQGIQLVIKSLPDIIRVIPKVKFTIIGSGPYEAELKEQVIKLHLEKYVVFLGYIPSHQEVENRIAKAAIAIAMYEEKDDNFTYYTDPGKVKNYLGAGVPVLITDVPYIARMVEKARCGIIVPYDKEKLSDKLIEFLSNEDMIKDYRLNALRFAKKYDWNKIFANAWDETFCN